MPVCSALVLGTTVLTLAMGRASAQSLDGTRPRDTTATRLGDLYREVTAANPRILAARSLALAAQARVPGAAKPPDPQLQLGFMNYTLPDLAPMQTVGMTQLQLMQMLPLGGKLALAGQAAGAQAAASTARADDVIWDLRGQTATAFYDLYTA